MTLIVQAQNKLPQPQTLLSSGSHSVQVPPFVFFIETQCDKRGNLYFHLDRGSYDSTDILKLSSDGQRGQEFKLTGKFADPSTTAFTNFSVTPEGELYVLAWENAGEALLFTFDSDGAMKSPTRLDVPEHVMPWDILAFDDGALLFSGYYDENAGPKLRGKRFVALFEPSGKVQKLLASSTFEDVNLAEVASKMREGGAARAEDGNTYLLGPKKVLVISQSGQIIRKIPFTKPDPASIASDIRVDAGLISIGLITFDDKSARVLKKTFLTLDASTGDTISLYESSPDLGYNDVCFSRNEGFTFVRNDKGHNVLLTAPLR